MRLAIYKTAAEIRAACSTSMMQIARTEKETRGLRNTVIITSLAGSTANLIKGNLAPFLLLNIVPLD